MRCTVMAVQNEYSLWTRQPELGLIQRCAQLGVAFVPFSPLARGVFGTPMADPATFAPGEFRTRIPRFHAENWPHNQRKLQAFHAFATARGFTPAALALAWLLDRAAHIIPIPGTRSAAHLQDWLAAPEIDLDDEDRDEIARLLPRRLGLGRPLRRRAVGFHGGTLLLTRGFGHRGCARAAASPQAAQPGGTPAPEADGRPRRPTNARPNNRRPGRPTAPPEGRFPP